MTEEQAIEQACENFKAIIKEQLKRAETISQGDDWTDYSVLKPIIIGICWGDGIGQEISTQAQRVLAHVLAKEKADGKVDFRIIEGLTIENRAKHGKAIPDDVLAELKQCHVILKGPTTTPQKGDAWPNIESANVAMRRELDLFACVRPIRIPRLNIDWTFFRENTEGAYVLGSRGLDIGDKVSFDFKVITEPGAERICRLAFEFAKKTGKKNVTVVTKSNVVKTTDGRFSQVAHRIAKDYEPFGIKLEEWYIDIMTAKLLDPARRSQFEVLVLPNLYGDILTDEAGQIQGGVGTAGSSNIGKRWSMFEAIHGSAPRMVKEGRAKFADPSSMIKAVALLLQHIGKSTEAKKVEMALDICAQFEQTLKITGRSDGATGEAFTQYVLDWINNPRLEETWTSAFSGVASSSRG